MQKVQNDNHNVEQFKAQQETNKNLKQELSRLKEMDLKELKAQQKRLNERKLAQMLKKRMRADEAQKNNMRTREQFIQHLKTTNNDVGRETSELKGAISDMLNANNYDKCKKKEFLKTLTKANQIKLPIGPEKVKMNSKGQVFVKQLKKGTVNQKSRGEYVPYDLSKGMRVEGKLETDSDKE